MTKARISDYLEENGKIIYSCTDCKNFLSRRTVGIGQCLHIIGPTYFRIPIYQYSGEKNYTVPIPDDCPLDIYQETEQMQTVNNKVDTTQIPKYSNFEEWAKANGADLDGGVTVSATSSLIDCPDATISKETIDRYSRLFGINATKDKINTDNSAITEEIKIPWLEAVSGIKELFKVDSSLSNISEYDLYRETMDGQKHRFEHSSANHGYNQLDNPEIEVNELGGKQSKLKERFDFLPPNAVSSCARTIGYGESKYGEGNWKKISILSHINHALGHLFKYLAKDKSEDHLSHAASRLLFALELEISNGKE